MGKNQPKKSRKNSSPPHTSPSNEFLALTENGGDVGSRLRKIDWEQTAVGKFETWPQSLRTALSICLGSRFPMFVWWGEDLTVFYNDAYIPLAGPQKHPQFLGRPAREQWSEIWNELGPLTQRVFESQRAIWAENMRLFMTRKGFLEETYFTFSYSPVRDESGSVGGIINPCQETTERVIGERRLRALHELGAQEVRTVEELGRHATQVFKKNSYDIPFALIYVVDGNGAQATRIASVGLATSSVIAPQHIDVTIHHDTTPWNFHAISQTHKPTRIERLRPQHTADLPTTPYEEKPDSAYSIPLEIPGNAEPIGFLVLGISSRLQFDSLYEGFLNLIAKQMVTHISNIRTLDNEKKRSDALAEIDRAKTMFFSNVSHEFRTPLTLLLGPVEEMLQTDVASNTRPENRLSKKNRENLDLVYRNALRLQKLVNSLLDFSRIESGRAQVKYRPVDISKFTAEIASSFETAIKKAGLKYKIRCTPIDEKVFVDLDLWEKVVLNLISNALKFTLTGQILVSIKNRGDGVCLEVQDTGSGIPESELPRIFDRFHRVENSKARTHEGSGIGLALVQEVVRLHGGRVSATSQFGHGSTFTVTIPFGFQHLPSDKVSKDEPPLQVAPDQSQAFVEESLRWSPVPPEKTEIHPFQTPLRIAALSPDAHAFQILLADDNQDMRDYILRLLLDSGRLWNVVAVTNGKQALDAARRSTPDLIVSDVMMPELDGFGLLKAIRGDKLLKTIPVILLSARAGEEAKVEGLERGADDYLIKPFSAKELIARVSTQLEMSLMRKEAAQQAQANLAKSQFLANMSHEIRTPLGVVLGFAELMLNPETTENERNECIRTIIQNGRHLTRVIDDILDLSKIESNKFEIENIQFSLAELVGDVTTLLNFQAQEKGLQFTASYEGTIPKLVCSDPSRLRQILVNIVGNAIKFTERGNVKLQIRYQPERSLVEFAVHDTGIGISANQQEHLFERFSQADNSMTRRYGGTGLGLVISQRIARALGGDLVLQKSQFGQGSTFFFTIQNQSTAVELATAPQLPTSTPTADSKTQNVDQPSMQDPEKKQEDPRHPLKTMRILLVDDSPDNRLLVGRILKLAGADVTFAEDGAEGVQSALGSNFDVVLMDIQMPKKDGFEATAELRHLNYHTPIIALTAHNMRGDREKCLQNGFDDHVAKPVDKNHLIAAIKNLVAM